MYSFTCLLVYLFSDAVSHIGLCQSQGQFRFCLLSNAPARHARQFNCFNWS